MKTMILYYSQSGNTQKIARAIRTGIKTLEAQDVILRFLDIRSKENIFKEMEEYDVIGIGSPVWYEMPPNVRKFVEEMPMQNKKMCFSFCTHGTMPDLYFPLVIPRLQKKGLLVLGYQGWYGNCCIQIFPEPYYTAGHPDGMDLKNAEQFGIMIARKAESVGMGSTVEIVSAPLPTMSPLHANAAIDHLGGFHNVHGKLVRDREKCLYPKCTICMDQCTMNYIDLSKEPQVFGKDGDGCDDCHGCTYCEMLCPTGAIHPVIPYEEIAPIGADHGSELFESILKKAEKEGKFRRVIELDKVGKKTPFYSIYDRHPRMKKLSFQEDDR